MERNNGVTAIIYLAFVRNRTLQPYFRSADTDAIFHSLTTFTFTQTPDAFATPFPSRTQRSLCYGCPSLWTSSEKNRKKKKKKKKKEKKTVQAGLGFSRHPEFPQASMQRVESFLWEWAITGKVSAPDGQGAGTFLPDWVHHGPWPSQPGQDCCSDKVAGSLLHGIEHHTAAHWLPDKNNLLGGSFHQSCTWKVDFRRIPDSQLKSMSKPHIWEPWGRGGLSLKPCWSY